MILESTQLLYTAHHFDPDVKWEGELKVYKKAHANHPMARWVRAAATNYSWLHKHAVAMSEEYTRRYGRKHACNPHLERLSYPPKNVPQHRNVTDYVGEFEMILATVNPPNGCVGAPLCMGDLHDKCKVTTPDGIDLVTSYRSYYDEKSETVDMSWDVVTAE